MWDICDILWHLSITEKIFFWSIILGQILGLSRNVPYGTCFKVPIRIHETDFQIILKFVNMRISVVQQKHTLVKPTSAGLFLALASHVSVRSQADWISIERLPLGPNGGFWQDDFTKKISFGFHIFIKKCPMVAERAAPEQLMTDLVGFVPWSTGSVACVSDDRPCTRLIHFQHYRFQRRAAPTPSDTI